MDFVKQEAVLIVYHASKFLEHEHIHEHMMAFPLHWGTVYILWINFITILIFTSELFSFIGT